MAALVGAADRRSSRIYTTDDGPPERSQDEIVQLGNLSPSKSTTSTPESKAPSSPATKKTFLCAKSKLNLPRIELLHHKRGDDRLERHTTILHGLVRERNESDDAYWFPVIEHDSWVKVSWDVVISLAVLFLLFFLPIDISFDFYEIPQGLYTFTKVLDYVFYVDIFLNFNTAFVHDGHVHYNKREIRRHYLSTWFLVDLLASIPFELFLSLEKSDRKSVKILKYFKLPKLLRLSTIFKYFMRYMKYWNVTQTSALLLVLLHFSACFWVSAIEPCEISEELTEAQSSIAAEAEGGHAAFDDVYIFKRSSNDMELYGGEAGPDLCNNDDLWGMYGKAMHTATLMVFLQSDVFSNDENFDLPLRRNAAFGRSNYATTLAMVFTAIGLTLILNLTGFVVAQAMYRRDSYTSFFRMYDRVNDEMCYHNLPQHIRYRVKKFYDYLWMHNKRPGTRSALAAFTDLSSSLQKEIAVELYKDALTKVALFSDVNDDCIFSVAMKLRTHIFLPDDIVVRRGEIAREMYIVQKGTVEVVKDADSTDVVMSLNEGDFFGEVALLTHNRRNMTVRARTVAELHTLTKQDLDEVLTDFPDVRRKIQEIASDRSSDTGSGARRIQGGLGGASLGGGNTKELLERRLSELQSDGPLRMAGEDFDELGPVQEDGTVESWAHIGSTSMDRLENRLETHIEHHVEKHVDRSIKIMQEHILKALEAQRSTSPVLGRDIASEASRELERARSAQPDGTP